jgi:folate-binding protein YgfZ
MSGYEALHDAAAWLDLSHRARIRATGEDRLRLLHALASNAVEGLLPGQGVRAFFLDAHGHILADSRIWVFDDHVLLDTEPETRQVLLDHLNKYIIMDDVSLEDVTDTMAMLAVEGPQALEIIEKTSGRVPDQSGHHVEHGGVTVIAASLTGQPGCWLIAAQSAKTELIGRWEAAGVVRASSREAAVVRVENAIPRHTEDFFVNTLPQESGRMDQVSFTKGCYLGQEIVERIRARGEVRRELASIEIDASESPAPGTAVLLAEREVGFLTSPVFSPRRGLCLGFSIVRREAAQPRYTLRVGPYAARFASLTLR